MTVVGWCTQRRYIYHLPFMFSAIRWPLNLTHCDIVISLIQGIESEVDFLYNRMTDFRLAQPHHQHIRQSIIQYQVSPGLRVFIFEYCKEFTSFLVGYISPPSNLLSRCGQKTSWSITPWRYSNLPPIWWYSNGWMEKNPKEVCF